ncbi:hypothetical protein, partial [Sulfuricurvum sp.]|uniref:hypothetical protein n=1 Tax=Sulfuricurvum sp. TaxID=2025608 RepID=UPI0026090907
DRPLASTDPLNEPTEGTIKRRRKEIVADRRFPILFKEPDFEALEANAQAKGLSTAGYIKMVLSEHGAFSMPQTTSDN